MMEAETITTITYRIHIIIFFVPMQHTVLNNHEWIEQARLCNAMLFVLLVTTVG